MQLSRLGLGLALSATLSVACNPDDEHPACAGGACDIGECKEPLEGRELVLSEGRLVYAGQAILNTACATGCHSTTATGGLRAGAPEGVDFDIVPIDLGGDGQAGLDDLGDRQAAIFERREELFRMVVTGEMPLEGLGDGLRKVSPGKPASLNGEDCELGSELPGLDKAATRETLRNWLACGAPIVETSGGVPEPVMGKVGDRYPSCTPKLEPTFENVYEAVFVGNGCTTKGCHGGSAADSVAAGFDLRGIDVAHASLVGAGEGQASTQCSPQARVVPGQPDASYLLTKLGGPGTLCGVMMPPTGTPIPDSQVELITEWIAAGAPAPGN